MQFSFGMDEVKKWAKFSCDYNPIHFNLEDAKRAGLDALILHGMLALLPVKQAVSKEYLQQNDFDAGWMKFRALFRNPIPHDCMVRLWTKTVDGGLNFRISEPESEREHFRGAYIPVGDPTPQFANDVAKIKFSTIPDGKNQCRFAEYYPNVQERWIELDAVIFSEFIRSEIQVFKEMSQMHGKNASKNVLFQTSHSVTFDTGFFADESLASLDFEQVTYGITEPEMISSDDQLIGTVSLLVMAGHRLVMLLEIGLIAKKLL